MFSVCINSQYCTDFSRGKDLYYPLFSWKLWMQSDFHFFLEFLLLIRICLIKGFIWGIQSPPCYNNYLLILGREKQTNRENRTSIWFAVPFICAFVGWFFCVPCPGIEPTTLEQDTAIISYPARVEKGFSLTFLQKYFNSHNGSVHW